ncbi:ADP-ribosylglycohydrolase family protein [Pectobacteriaceae bacterium CE90]|nr:ADP-ribosylglycohydrolase family protein [Prodigiosinella sp. LS101]WJV54323.1 ADP-ribosylglycohydrolase family protein [Prodigiosinella sp. LS101]WJV58685.1 ADP-ribosylglycohydrolase family protein [Pectobacteriaceae bacterium C111]WJY14660.1 ADP-ribosylglycohydrolase family protein [Pectobacteriaceae bacterium CE90]
MTAKRNPHDAILGCLYGQAVGDAMGMPSELWPQEKVRHYFGWISDFLPGPDENIAAKGFIAGEYTDDTQQAIALLNAVIEANGEVEPERIAKHILSWADHINAFEKNVLGPSSKAALNAIRTGISVHDIVANGVTNGAAMRIAPVGCLMATTDKMAFIDAVRQASSPTHKSDIAVAGAFAIAWAISRAIEGASWEEIKAELPVLTEEVQQQHITTFCPQLGRRIMQALTFVENLRDLPDPLALSELYDTLGAGMDTLESVPMALAIVELAATIPQRCAILAANLGGDTDTIGAMATAICGALHGISAFPAAWISTINQANSVDFIPLAAILSELRLKRSTPTWVKSSNKIHTSKTKHGK